MCACICYAYLLLCGFVVKCFFNDSASIMYLLEEFYTDKRANIIWRQLTRNVDSNVVRLPADPGLSFDWSVLSGSRAAYLPGFGPCLLYVSWYGISSSEF